MRRARNAVNSCAARAITGSHRSAASGRVDTAGSRWPRCMSMATSAVRAGSRESMVMSLLSAPEACLIPTNPATPPAAISPASPIAKDRPHRTPQKAARNPPQGAAQSRWPYADGGGGAAGQAAFLRDAHEHRQRECGIGGFTLSQWSSEAKFVAIRIGQVKEPLAPFSIAWCGVWSVAGRNHARIEGVAVGMVEDDTSPPRPISLRGLCDEIEKAGSGPKTCKRGVITTMNDLKSQHAIEGDGARHVVGGQRDGTDALDHRGTAPFSSRALGAVRAIMSPDRRIDVATGRTVRAPPSSPNPTSISAPGQRLSPRPTADPAAMQITIGAAVDARAEASAASTIIGAVHGGGSGPAIRRGQLGRFNFSSVHYVSAWESLPLARPPQANPPSGPVVEVNLPHRLHTRQGRP